MSRDRHERRKHRRDRYVARQRKRLAEHEPPAFESIMAALTFDPPPGSMACKRCGALYPIEELPPGCSACGCPSFVGGVQRFGGFA